MKKILTNNELTVLQAKGKKSAEDAYKIGEHYFALGNYQAAHSWYEKASNLPKCPPIVFFNLAYASQHGQGAPQDMSEAFRLYQKAADLGLPQAYYNLAYFYQNGIIVNADSTKAYTCLNKAAELLHEDADALYNHKQVLVELETANHALEDLERFRTAKISVERDLAAAKQALAAAEAKSAAAEKEKTTVANSLQTAVNQQKLLETKLKVLEEQHVADSAHSKMLEASFSGLQKYSQKQSEDYLRNTKTLENLQTAASALQDHYSDLSDSFQNLQSLLVRCQTENKDLHNQLSCANNLIEQRQKDIENLTQRKPILTQKVLLIILIFLELVWIGSEIPQFLAVKGLEIAIFYFLGASVFLLLSSVMSILNGKSRNKLGVFLYLLGTAFLMLSLFRITDQRFSTFQEVLSCSKMVFAGMYAMVTAYLYCKKSDF